jgi:hypothetical protein
MRGENEQVAHLSDYAPGPYLIEHVELDVRVAAGSARVRALLTIVPREGTAPATPLVLDGDGLKLDAIAIDGLPLALTAYDEKPTTLSVAEPPPRRFILETEVTLDPENNLRLMGLYRSSGTWCTQCEPEGFRRITWYLDRPDILARFKVRITADPKLAPVLLSNGNLVDKGALGDGQHYAVWEDPFPKPAYLFALVAGDLGSIHDSFTTQSGRAPYSLRAHHFLLFRLIQLHLNPARHFEVSDESIAVVFDGAREFDAAVAEFADGGFVVVAVERDVGRAAGWAVFVRGVDAQVGFGSVEDQPAVADVGAREAQLVVKKSSQFVRLRGIEHRMHTSYHE